MSAQSQSAPRLSIIVPVHNGAAVLGTSLRAICESLEQDIECIVVDDGSTDESASIARRFPVKLMESSAGPAGPACARNRGALAARGDVLFFVDADVAIGPDVCGTLLETFAAHPEVDAVFGSYDDLPHSADFVSQYKNLFHHFVHQQGREHAETFWSGCGAVRRTAFLAVGGFDEARYARPSIEDIELGRRLRLAGRRIILNKAVQAKHLKHWSLRRMVESDIWDRAVPWTLLIMRERQLPDDLNLAVGQRVSALLLCVAVVLIATASVLHDVSAVILPLLGGLALLVVGYWPWNDMRAPSASWRAELTALGLTAVIGMLAVRTGLWVILPLLAPAAIGLLAGRAALPLLAPLRGRRFYVVCILGLCAAGVAVLMQAPLWLQVALPISLLLIVLVNAKLYAFYARRRGVLFAVNAFPLQLLYYGYSLLALGVAAVLHARALLVHQASKPPAPAGQSSPRAQRSPDAA
jgi:GT2 family glycosyltransferase